MPGDDAMIDGQGPNPVLDYRDASKDRREVRIALWERLADGIIYAAVWASGPDPDASGRGPARGTACAGQRQPGARVPAPQAVLSLGSNPRDPPNQAGSSAPTLT